MGGRDIIQEIEQKRRFGSLPGVMISRQLLAAAGNPQNGLAYIHIAGTNGKGSAAAFLCSILREAGIRTGLFTSPHLIDFTERIQVDGKRISKAEAEEIGSRLLGLNLDMQPSMFDYCLAMALIYFKKENCRLAVLETGLGGRLDSTNALDVPLVSIITKIGYDHMEILGGTLSEIAAEKAGILKKGTRAILESQKAEALDTLVSACRKQKIPFRIVEADKIVPEDGGFRYPGESVYRPKMLGEFQRENAMAAVLAARELMQFGFPVTEESLHRGVEHAVWKGRMEIVSVEPFLLADGAHNADGAAAMAESLKAMYPGEKFCFIMGVLADKNYEAMVQEILPYAAKVITVTPESSRALQGEKLAEYIRGFGISAEHRESLGELLDQILHDGGKTAEGRKTAAFGSLYFIGEIERMMQTGKYS